MKSVVSVAQPGRSVGRADLVRWLQHAERDIEALARVAPLAGFQLTEPVRPVVEEGLRPSEAVNAAELPAQRPVTPTTKPAARWFQLTERIMFGEQEGDTGTQEPLSIQGVGDFSAQELEALASAPQYRHIPLVRWPRLWPVLKRAACAQVNIDIDIERAATSIASGELFRRLPTKRRLRWASNLVVLVDCNARTQPFWDDFHRLCQALERLRGKFGLDVRLLGNVPGGPYRRWQAPHEGSRPWRMPQPGTPVLVLSDLGMLEQEGSVIRRQWRRFGRDLRAAGCQVFALAPAAGYHVDAELAQDFYLLLWSRQSRLLRQRRPTGVRNAGAVERLLGLLSPAARIEPELLRAVCGVLPAYEADAGVQADFWRHPDLHVSPLACELRAETIESHRADFRAEPPALQREVLRLMHIHHAHLPPEVRHEETLCWASLVVGPTQQEFAHEISCAETFMRKYARMLYVQRDEPDAVAQAYGNRHIARTHRQMRERHPYLGVVFGLANETRVDPSAVLQVPAGIDVAEVLRALARGTPRKRALYQLKQSGERLVLSRADRTEGRFQDVRGGSLYARFETQGEAIFVSEGHDATWRYVELDNLPQPIALLKKSTVRIVLRSANEMLTIAGFDRPSWARAIGRNGSGLYVGVDIHGKRFDVGWPPGTRLDQDAFGLYAVLTLGDVTQHFRWIAPGTFLMGSPESEAERGPNETLHQVTLTQGYWLADSACTQALWQAVMGENPSEFKGDPRYPVENVSWDDAQRFIAKLNGRAPGLNACLPSEAQWEYACRAGTTTPFSFGENITPEQVNYHGEYPYRGRNKGVFRGHTVQVTSLPANAWGLYEMHGNVWEWCEDWYADYGSVAQVDPRGARAGAVRVLRGGSWASDGRIVRSACRDGNEPGFRYRLIGFRLALGQSASRQEAPAKEPRGTRGGKAGAPAEPKASEGMLSRVKRALKRK